MDHGLALALIGFGLTMVTALLPGAWPAMPKELYWAGIAVGVVLMVAGVWPFLRRGVAKVFGKSQAPAAPEMISLREAAGQALEQTRNSSVALGLKGYGADEHKTVYGYFCAMLEQRTPIYGKTPPANDWVRLERFEPQEETLWEMNSIKQHHKPVRITDLSVRADDLKRFIEQLQAEVA